VRGASRHWKDEGAKTMSEPTRARAVLSTDDFKLLKEAVRFYLQANEDAPDAAKYSNLYHRLGTASRR
jgi:hypothetical protein